MIWSQEGNNRRAMTLIAYQPTTPRAPKIAMETTQNRTERFDLAFSYTTTTPRSIGIRRNASCQRRLAESLNRHGAHGHSSVG